MTHFAAVRRTGSMDEFSPLNEALEDDVWRRVDPPPPGTDLAGTYDVRRNTVFLDGPRGMWSYRLDGAGYEQLLSRPPGLEPMRGELAWDDETDRLPRYEGGSVVQSLDPASVDPAWTTASPAGGALHLEVDLANGTPTGRRSPTR